MEVNRVRQERGGARARLADWVDADGSLHNLCNDPISFTACDWEFTTYGGAIVWGARATTDLGSLDKLVTVGSDIMWVYGSGEARFFKSLRRDGDHAGS